MLDKDYKQLLDDLIASVRWDIEVPGGKEAYFRETGIMSTCELNSRVAARMRARAHGVAMFEQTLPAIPRSPQPIGIYTSDFSKTGIGFVAAQQFFPEEVLRIILPTFWIRVRVMRCDQRGPKFYSSGGILTSSQPPSLDAFDLQLQTA